MCTLFCASIQYVKKISTKPDYCVDFHTKLPQDLLLFSGGSPAKKQKNKNQIEYNNLFMTCALWFER